jgi:integrase
LIGVMVSFARVSATVTMRVEDYFQQKSDGDKKGPLFRAIHKGDKLTENPITRIDVFRMIKRRAEAAALPYSTSCHTFRATGITTYMQN